VGTDADVTNGLGAGVHLVFPFVAIFKHKRLETLIFPYGPFPRKIKQQNNVFHLHQF
jgi:hypothetical protein